MPQESPKRLYSAKDAVMLTALSIILNNAADNIAELTDENENWNTALLTALKAQVDKDFEDILGIDPKKDQREATAFIKSIQAEAMPLLSTFSLRLSVAVKDAARRSELLNQLGFTAFAKKAQTRDQIALIELLAKFRKNMTAEVKAEVTASKDIKGTMVDTLVGFADTLQHKNITQETYKVKSKEVTAESVIALNNTYSAVVSNFSKLVLDFYTKKKSPKKALFSFTAIAKTVKAAAKVTTEPPATPK
jgi:hypothetical protein